MEKNLFTSQGHTSGQAGDYNGESDLLPALMELAVGSKQTEMPMEGWQLLVLDRKNVRKGEKTSRQKGLTQLSCLAAQDMFLYMCSLLW